MVKAEVIETFTFKDYAKLEIITKRGNKPNEFQKGDVFICDDETAKYLSGKNPLNKKVINVFEIIPESKIEYPKEGEKLDVGVKITPVKQGKTKAKKIDKKAK